MEVVIALARAFLVGGSICAVGQVLIDRTALTPARILVSFVVAGVVLGDWGSTSRCWTLPGRGPRCRLPASERCWLGASGRQWRRAAPWGRSPAGSPPRPAASPQRWSAR